MTDFPSDLVDLQRSADAAWAAVDAHRRQVDAARNADADAAEAAARAAGERLPPRADWERRALRPWTEEEDSRLRELRGIAVAAQEAVKAALVKERLGLGIEAVQGLRKAAHKAET